MHRFFGKQIWIITHMFRHASRFFCQSVNLQEERPKYGSEFGGILCEKNILKSVRS
jgi:hypothetical protein